MKVTNKPKNGANQMIKPYNIALIDENTAEINMYGDVVAKVPRDWRTNERLAGYIGADEFLEDLEEVKDKDTITVHINSGGGDLYAGLAIYNRMKTLKGQVITVNDGLAASAASLIFQAGDVRKMNAGSNLMAHGVSGFLFGFYNIDDLKKMVTEFKAHNKAVVNVYAEAMSVTYDEAKSLIESDTWLTGQEAVEKGLADEVVEEEEEDEDDDQDGLFNRIMGRMQSLYNLTPAQMAQTKPAIAAAVPPIADKNKSIEGGTDEMEIKNVEDLKNTYPEYVAQIENAAGEKVKKQHEEEERERIKAIEAIENSIADKDLVNEAKYGENPMTAEQLAYAAMQKQAAIGTNMLDQMEDDAKESGAESVTATPHGGTESAEEEESVEESAKGIANIYNKIFGGAK